jgi:hypothetical protein
MRIVERPFDGRTRLNPHRSFADDSPRA